MSISLSGSLVITGSIVASGGITGSFSGSATTSSYALTASSVLPLNQTLIVSGSTSITGSLQVTGSIVTTGTLTAQTLVVQTITSSIVYSSGSNIFGNQLTDVQQMTGSLRVTGSLNLVGTSPSMTISSSGAGAIGQFLNTAGNTVIGMDNLGGYFIPSQKGIAIYDGSGTKYLYVTSSGVGIGTTTPARTLDVTGTLRVVTPNRSFFITSNAYSISDGTLSSGIGMDGDGLYLGNVTSSTGWTISNPQLFISSSGNVGIGTSSPSFRLSFGGDTTTTVGMNQSTLGTAPTLTLKGADSTTGTNNEGGAVNISAGLGTGNGATSNIIFSNGAPLGSGATRQTLTERMRITPVGSVCIGSSNSFYGNATRGSLSLAGSLDSIINFQNPTNTESYTYLYSDDTASHNFYIQNTTANGNLYLATNATVRMTVENNGRVTMSSPSTYVLTINNTTNTTGQGTLVTSMGSNNNNGSSYHYIATTGGGDKCYILGNGNLQNVNNSYGALSDIRLKKEVTQATPKLQDLLKINIVNFKFINDETETKQIGVIAQELEEIFPSLVEESTDRETNESRKSVKYSVFVPILIKAIQEQQIQIESQNTLIQEVTTRLTALENK